MALKSQNFELLKHHLSVQDLFSSNQHLLFTWNNQHIGDARILARLDCVYTFASLDGALDSHIKTYLILGDCVLSDHLPMTYKLELQFEQPMGSQYKVNAGYLKDPAIVAKLKQQWQQPPPFICFLEKSGGLLDGIACGAKPRLMLGKKGSNYYEGSFSALRKCSPTFTQPPCLTTNSIHQRRTHLIRSLDDPKPIVAIAGIVVHIRQSGNQRILQCGTTPHFLDQYHQTHKCDKTCVHKPGRPRRHLLLISLPCTRPAPSHGR